MNMAISFYNNGFEGAAISTPAFISCSLNSNTSIPTPSLSPSLLLYLSPSLPPSFSISLTPSLSLSLFLSLPPSLHPFSSSGMLDSLLSRVGEVCVHFVVMVAVPIVLTHLQITNGQ